VPEQTHDLTLGSSRFSAGRPGLLGLILFLISMQTSPFARRGLAASPLRQNTSCDAGHTPCLYEDPGCARRQGGACRYEDGDWYEDRSATSFLRGLPNMLPSCSANSALKTPSASGRTRDDLSTRKDDPGTYQPLSIFLVCPPRSTAWRRSSATNDMLALRKKLAVRAWPGTAMIRGSGLRRRLRSDIPWTDWLPGLHNIPERGQRTTGCSLR